jgi:hypothetical protein
MANRKACSVLIVALVAFTGLRHAFVPPPARSAVPMAAAGGMLSTLDAQAAHADKIDDAAKKLSEASYPSLKEIDWTSDVFAKVPTQNPASITKAIDKMIVMGSAMDGAALKAKTVDVHNAIAKFNLGKDIGPYMMFKVNAADAKSAYVAFLDVMNVVKASM